MTRYPMRTVIALDLGTNTGIAGCTLSSEMPPVTWVYSFTIPGYKWRGEAFAHFADTVQGRLASQLRGAVEIVYEQAHHRGGPATRFALGLSAIVEMWAGQRGIPCYPVHTATLKLRATGDGHAGKEQMRAAALTNGWVPVGRLEQATEDEIDALCLLHCWIRDGQGMLGARERRAQVRREKVVRKRGA